MDKRGGAGRPTLADYLRLAAMQYELDKEEAQEAQNQGINLELYYIFVKIRVTILSMHSIGCINFLSQFQKLL